MDASDADVLGQVISIVKQLPPEDRERVVRAIATFFDVEFPTTPARQAIPSRGQMPSGEKPAIAFSEDLAPTPKEFILQKQPKTDVERVACLAYYLTHYRGTPYFKTLDLSKLNTEAALPKFANATWASNNALKMGYLAAATRGNRQISAAGEQFVIALPDRDAAKKAMENVKPRRRSARRNAEKSIVESGT